jgi:hypothetical protein
MDNSFAILRKYKYVHNLIIAKTCQKSNFRFFDRFNHLVEKRGWRPKPFDIQAFSDTEARIDVYPLNCESNPSVTIMLKTPSLPAKPTPNASPSSLGAVSAYNAVWHPTALAMHLQGRREDRAAVHRRLREQALHQHWD